MKRLQCDLCGGDIEREGNYYVCRHCKNKWEIDVADNVHAVDRANAWSALRDGDFERATELFEEIISKEKNGHEAYWGRALALGGIVYVNDLCENKKVPTCNNITEDSFIKAKDVQEAISLAPNDIAETYKSQAEYIEKVRIEWLEKASKEPAYDVFISFKDSDRDNGIERTQDSYDAQDLYNALIAEGYKVFFSRVSLRDKISEQYEPYIYNAIRTSKVMIVFGEKHEYFSSVWIKNEWSRFRNRIEKGEKHKNSLVVVYKDMNPGDLPAVLKARQCLNRDDVTFFTDLTRHIKRIVDEEKKNVHLDRIKIEGGQMSKKATELTVNSVKTREIGTGAIAETSINEKQSIKLIHTYLKVNDWNGANSLIEDILFDNPSCAEAIWCKILVSCRVSDEAGFERYLSSIENNFADMNLLTKLLNCSTKEFAARILDLIYGVNWRTDQLQKSLLELVLPFSYPGRKKGIEEAFEVVINKTHVKSFELLLTTLASNEVDRYISYNLRFATAANYVDVKKKHLKNILAVDEGNIEVLRLLVDIGLKEDKDAAKIKADLENLLKYAKNADTEVLRIFDKLLSTYYSPGKCGIEFARQLLRYYSGVLVDLKDRLLKFADKLLKMKQFNEAKYYYDLVLSVDKNCAEVYWGLCLIKVGASSDDDVINSDIPVKDCAEFNKYLTLVDEKRQLQCLEIAKKQEYNKNLKNAERLERKHKERAEKVQMLKERKTELDKEILTLKSSLYGLCNNGVGKKNRTILILSGVALLLIGFIISLWVLPVEFDSRDMPIILSVWSGIIALVLCICSLLNSLEDENNILGCVNLFLLGFWGFIVAIFEIKKVKDEKRNLLNQIEKKKEEVRALAAQINTIEQLKKYT